MAMAAPVPTRVTPDEALSITPEAAARAARLRYVSDDMPGIRREQRGEEFAYVTADGSEITDEKELERFRGLGIPPAWTEVWICPNPRGHIQATGRDARGRKQYRYHERWRAFRDETKYSRMLAFADALPKIREQVDADLRRHGMPREKVLATIVRLLETTFIRIGNLEYAKQNYSYGLTTLHNRHVDVDGSTVKFHFRGKSGKVHDIGIRDQRVARVVRKCLDMPGFRLFEYLDEDGEIREIESDDVNQYLREITDQDFTAKDFRTWAGTVLAATHLHEFEDSESETQAKKNVAQAIKEVSSRLGNTPAVCRKCYVHPAVIECYMEGTLAQSLATTLADVLDPEPHGLRPEEAAVKALLQLRLAAQDAAAEEAAEKPRRPRKSRAARSEKQALKQAADELEDRLHAA